MGEKDNINELTKLAQMVNDKNITTKGMLDFVDITNKNANKRQSTNINKKEDASKKKIKSYNKKRVKKAFTIATSCLLLGIGASEGYHSLKEYEEKAYTNSLNAVKTAIAESTPGIPNPDVVTLHNNSTRLGSNHELELYKIKVKGKDYAIYSRDILDLSEPNIKIDTINNPEIIKAIQIVSAAQDGNFFQAWRANGLTEDIESGKLDLEIKNKKSIEKEDIEEER